jgi:hypothetical protein
MLPDFVIVGAMKCGTSTLAAQLGRQEGVFVTTPKEPNFFSDDAVHAQGLDWYRDLFREARPGDIKGEASTHYTMRPVHPRAVERMSAVLTAPKIVYIIRNPIARAVSHYIHEWSVGNVSADLATAAAAHPEIVDFGRYGMQIAPFVEAFGAENVLLASLEGMKADPQGELARVCRFIGLAAPPVWHAEAAEQNVSAERFRPLPMQRLLVNNPVAVALRRTLIPKSWREKVRKARSMTVRPEVPDALRGRMEEVFLEDRARLAELFPGHPALDDAYGFARADS